MTHEQEIYRLAVRWCGHGPRPCRVHLQRAREELDRPTNHVHNRDVDAPRAPDTVPGSGCARHVSA